MSLATASNGAPDAKKFRYSPETMFDLNQNQGQTVNNDQLTAECSMAESTSFGNSPTNNSPSMSPIDSTEEIKLSTEIKQEPSMEGSSNFLSLFLEQFKNPKPEPELKPSMPAITKSINSNSIHAPIPGALAVAASPAARLFSQDDWSWHRNPAAAIRSGGTNKQTPVWKYFVYNKTENLSRCIIGDCTYMLKGPHTSTLACHLKKHPAEYAEFQKLKMDYSKDRTVGGMPNPNQRNGRSSAASNVSNNSLLNSTSFQNNRSGSSTPSNVNNLLKKTMEQSAFNGIFGNSGLFTNNVPPTPQRNSPSKPISVNEILNNLSAQAVNMMPNASSPMTVHTSTNSNHIAIDSNPLWDLLKQTNKPASNPASILQQNRKWARQDRKQKDLEQKLALLMSVCQLPTSLVNDSFFRDFIEQLQPKFYIPEEVSEVDYSIQEFHSKIVSNIQTQLAAANKFTLLLDITFNEQHSSTLLTVSAAFYSQSHQNVEVAVLGVRRMGNLAEPEKSIVEIVNQVLSEHKLGTHQVIRTLISGLSLVGLEDTTKILPPQLICYQERLQQALSKVFEESEEFSELKEITRISFANLETMTDVCDNLSFLNGVDLNKITEFNNVIKQLVEEKSNLYNKAQLIPSLRQTLEEIKWNYLESLARLNRLFKAHMQVIQDNSYATIDRVVPSTMQLLMSLEKDFPHLGQLSSELIFNIKQKLGYILNSDDENFDGSFIQATALNPQLVVLLDEQQMNCAREGIKSKILDRIRSQEESSNRRTGKNGGVDALLAVIAERNGATNVNDQSESGGDFTSALYPDLIQAANQRRKQIKEKNQTGKNHYAEAMVHAYFDDVLNHGTLSTIFGNVNEMPQQPLAFWQWGSAKFPALSELAIELLSIPSSTIAPERILNSSFETPSSFCDNSHSFVNTSNDLAHLKRDVVVRFNRNFWPKSFL